VRMIAAGIILILIGAIKSPQKMAGIWKDKHAVLDLILFSIAGLMFCQYAYINAIAYSNAGTATVLQYTAPVFIMIYVCLRNKKPPTKLEGFCVLLAIGGTFLLSTHGNIKTMVLSSQALQWGLFAALGLAFYTLLPVNIMAKWSSTVVTGYGMLIGGVVLSLLGRVWNLYTPLDFKGFLIIGVITLVGTLLAFWLYLQGVHDIGAVKASMLASVEPLSATLFAAFWLKSKISPIDIVGFSMIMATVFLLAKRKK
ncbi:MAG: EamA family transporter, partial [Oscillospiraceae bacterium]